MTAAMTALVCGIIPARAGFTEKMEERLDGVKDHPRSRGVYTLDGNKIAALNGSSPLARGLLPVILNRSSLNRIIPARAGFTS